MDVVGDQKGAHHCAGLRSLIAELLKNLWSRLPWPGHACDACRRTLEVNGEARYMMSAV